MVGTFGPIALRWCVPLALIGFFDRTRGRELVLVSARRAATPTKRWCTPSVNGMTGAEFSKLLTAFRVIETHSTPLLQRFPILGRPGQWLNRVIAHVGGNVAEAISFNFVCVLEKPL